MQQKHSIEFSIFSHDKKNLKIEIKEKFCQLDEEHLQNIYSYITLNREN